MLYLMGGVFLDKTQAAERPALTNHTNDRQEYFGLPVVHRLIFFEIQLSLPFFCVFGERDFSPWPDAKARATHLWLG